MKTVNMHEAKTHLSRLVEGAVNGEPFVIARAGKPLVKVVPVEERRRSPFGRLEGQFTIPDTLEEFKAIAADEIRLMEESELFPGEGSFRNPDDPA